MVRPTMFRAVLERGLLGCSKRNNFGFRQIILLIFQNVTCYYNIRLSWVCKSAENNNESKIQDYKNNLYPWFMFALLIIFQLIWCISNNFSFNWKLCLCIRSDIVEWRWLNHLKLKSNDLSFKCEFLPSILNQNIEFILTLPSNRTANNNQRHRFMK